MINQINKKSYFPLLTKRKKINKDKNNFLLSLLYIFGIISYLLSLQEMEGIGMTCFNRNRIQCLYILISLTFISSFFISISLFLIIIKNYKKYHLLIIFIAYVVLFLKDHNNIIIKHGLYNFLAFLILTIILFILFCYLKFIIYLIYKRKFFIFIAILISNFYFALKIIIYKSKHFSCDNWIKGLNNSYIDNISKDYPCKIDIPKPHSCYISEIGKYFDFNKIYSHNCSEPGLMKYEKKKFLKEISDLKYLKISKKNIFGYPLTNNKEFQYKYYGCMIRPGKKNFENDINKKIILMDLFNKNKRKYYPNIDKPEIQVILTKNGGKIKFTIEKNTSLIQEREEILKRNNFKEIYKNVLIIFIDSLSRVHFHRKFVKTKKFLEQFSKYEPNSIKNNIKVFQFFKYQSINSFTDPNIKAAYYGAKVRGKGKHFANFFKNKGFIIGRVNTFCEKEIVFNRKNPSMLEPAIWDHEGLSLGCIKSIYGRFLISRLTCLIKKCLFGKNLNQQALEYLESFWTTYMNQYKLFLFQTLDGHEPTGELIGYFDEILYNFLNKFNKNGYFKNTAIIIFSDHGMQLNGPLYLMDSQDFNYERNLPTLFLLVPNDKKLYRNDFFEIIKSNQQTLITAYDIYNTLINLASGENKEEYKINKVSYGESLFSRLNYKKRYCESSIYEELQIPKNVCRCQKKLF